MPSNAKLMPNDDASSVEAASTSINDDSCTVSIEASVSMKRRDVSADGTSSHRSGNRFESSRYDLGTLNIFAHRSLRY